MNLRNIKPLSVITDKLLINTPVFVHLVPDFNTTGGDLLQYLNLDYSRCHALIIKTSIFKLGSYLLQPRKYYTQIKTKKDLPVNVLQNLPGKLPTNKYFIIDHTVTTQGVEHLRNTIGEKQSTIYLVQQLKNEFRNLKSLYPKYEQLVIFSISSPNGMYDIVSKFYLTAKFESLNFFDNYSLVAVNAGTDATTFIPILHYDQKGNVDVLKTNLTKIRKSIELATPSDIQIIDDKEKPLVAKAEDHPILADRINALTGQSEQSDAESDINDDYDKLDSLTTDIANDTITDNIKKDLESEMYKVQTEIDSARLSKVLKNFKIQDENVANNIKIVVDDYIDKFKDQEIRKTDLENLVLKSIHYSLFGTNKVADIYKANPNQLISKLEETETFTKHISYPEPIHKIGLVSPEDINQITRVTGPVRHKFEFNENIHDNIKLLFKSLEQKPNYPVKVQKFNYEYIDDNLNRFIEYTVTLKNIAGGKSEPYDVKVRIPALVNDKYFKLNGQEYIIASQAFLHPLTKDKHNESRLISHYGMIRLRTVNMKFNISQIDDIVNYIKLKYPVLIDSSEVDINGKITKVTFIDPKRTILDFNSSAPFKNSEKEIYFEENNYFLKDLKSGKSQKVNKSEYIFEQLSQMIKDIAPSDDLKKSKKTMPYLEIFVMSRKLPFIIWLWQQMGLINAFTKLNIKYEISKTPTMGVPDINLVLENGNYLYVYGNNKREELVINGLFSLPKGFSITSDKLNDKTSLDDYINEKFGSRTISTLNLATANFIDPVTDSLLKYQDLPNNLIDVCTGPLVNKLLNDSVDAPNDLRSLRVRQSEQMAQILYKEISMSHNKYVNDIQYGIENANMFLDPNYVSDNLIGKHMHSGGDSDSGSALAYVNCHNPVDEINFVVPSLKNSFNCWKHLRAC